MELEQLIAAHEHVGWCASERAGRELPSAWEASRSNKRRSFRIKCQRRHVLSSHGSEVPRQVLSGNARDVRHQNSSCPSCLARRAERSFISGSAPRISRDTRLELERSATRPGSPTSQRLQQRCQQQWYTAVPRRHTRCIRAAAPHAAPHASLPCGVHMHLTSFVHASKLVALRPGSLQCLGFQRAGLCRAQHLSPIARRTATASGETSGCKFGGGDSVALHSIVYMNRAT